MKTIPIVIASAMVQFLSLNVAHAASTNIIDHGDYLTDTLSGLDWLDVTQSVNRSFNDVSAQFGTDGDYEGYRYATGLEYNGLVKNYTDEEIDVNNYETIVIAEGKIDG